MLNNLQMARPGQQGGDGDDEMNQALDQLGDMIRRQQQLRDRTFEQGQDQRRQQGQRGQKGQKGQRGQQGQRGEQENEGQPGQQGQQGMGDLREQQQALREQLNKLLDELRKRGIGQHPASRARARWISSAAPARTWAGRGPARRGQCRQRRRFAGPRARSAAPRHAEPRAVDAAGQRAGTRPRPARRPRPGACATGDRSARPAAARAPT